MSKSGATPLIRLGAVGLGRAFTVMVPTFALDPRVQLVAGADPLPEARARFEQDFAAEYILRGRSSRGSTGRCRVSSNARGSALAANSSIGRRRHSCPYGKTDGPLYI